MLDTDRAYIAGFVDGEGCISFQHVGKNKNTFCYSPVVTLANNSLNLLKRIQRLTGGAIYKQKRYSHKHSKAYKLSFTNQNEMLGFLTSIKDHLVLKKKQAELVCEYIESRLTKIKQRGQHSFINDQEKSLISRVRKANSKYNKRVKTEI